MNRGPLDLSILSHEPYSLLMHLSHQEEDRRQSLEGIHRPVLLEEVIAFLQPRSGGFYIDATIGLGGHSEALLKASSPSGTLLGIDRDLEALDLVTKRLASYTGRYQLVHANFSQLKEIAAQRHVESCDGILFDLGVSSLQLDSPERGFSFQKNGPLDMRMDRELSLTAGEVVNHYPEKDLANLIYQYGEEPLSRRIARNIVKARPHHSTQELADVIAKATHFRGYQRIHPATRTFQALRIFVNDELSQLSQVLQSATDLLARGGKVVALSFHSLEDRIVKQTFRALSLDCVCSPGLPRCVCGNRKVLRLLTRGPIQAGQNELLRNPRSRSAKLRAAEKL
jgi:16S rRNA (cytosine1402-N4)-methyltransferase